jgi:hypothetical protein
MLARYGPQYGKHFAVINIAAHILVGGNLVFDCTQGDDSDGFVLHFSLPGTLPMSRLHEAFRTVLDRAGISWIRPHRDVWEVDLDGARAEFDSTLKAEWIHGRVSIEPEVTNLASALIGGTQHETRVALRFDREEVVVNQRNRIFLSHKGANKPLVKRYYKVLKELGFEPWLDEEDIVAGHTLHRELLGGMKASCAAVFFITPEFRDEKYLAHEIDLAMNERTARSSQFRIITLSIADQDGARGTVPEQLKSLVFKEPAFELDALYEILRALPITVQQPIWRQDR